MSIQAMKAALEAWWKFEWESTSIADGNFIAAANPETIKQLVELVRLQHEALKHWGEFTYEAAFSTSEAIEAFNKWSHQ